MRTVLIYIVWFYACKIHILAYVKKKRILPEENLEEKNEILDHTCRKNSSRRKPSGVGRKANPEI